MMRVTIPSFLDLRQVLKVCQEERELKIGAGQDFMINGGKIFRPDGTRSKKNCLRRRIFCVDRIFAQTRVDQFLMKKLGAG